MTDTSANNKRIAKNTLLLYIRMLFLMAVSLYTSRVVLQALGVEDFGIYNVVGGVVAMFSMLSGSLSASITRFITYELGKGSTENLNRIFSTSLAIQLGLSLLIVLLAETAGLWFLNVKMNIPDSRMFASNWVFQLSILTFVINLLSVPYNACIIAHERMSAFAYISILEVLGGIAFQVNAAVQGFVVNFMTALNPQITKSYASGDRRYMQTLVFQGARLSFYMLLLLSLPVLINTRFILDVWLGVLPEHAVSFVRLVLVLGMSEAISQPLITAMLATGRIRNYQLIVGGLQMMNLPLSYVLLRAGCFPEMVFVVAILLSQCCLAARLWLLRSMIGLPVRAYLSRVYLNVLSVALVASLLPFAFTYSHPETFLNFLWNVLATMGYTAFVIYFLGCNREERLFIINKIVIIKNKLLRK